MKRRGFGDIDKKRVQTFQIKIQFTEYMNKKPAVTEDRGAEKVSSVSIICLNQVK